MSKNKIITTLIACALGFSVLAAYLIWRFMSPQRGTMYVFNADYSVGDQIKAEMLVPVQVDSTVVDGGRRDGLSTRFVTPSEYNEIVHSGQSLRADVSEGMPLMADMLSVSGGSTVEMNMKSDTIAVTVPVDRYSGVTNDLKAGARVNVYATMGGVTTLIQQNKRVLEVFRNEGAVIGASLDETLDESMELIYAMNAGKIYFGLVDATGYQSREGDDPWYAFDSGALFASVEKPDEAAAYEDYLDSYASRYATQGGSTLDEAADVSGTGEESDEAADDEESAGSGDEAKKADEPTADGALFEP